MGGGGRGEKETVIDVGSAAESIASGEETEVPFHQIESLCMRCGENVRPFSLFAGASLFTRTKAIIFWK